MPDRIQLSRRKGWRMPENTVKVDRSTKWGNPFVIGKPGGAFTALVKDRRHAWQLYASFAPDHPKLAPAARAELRGKNLACWCPLPSEPYAKDECHAAVLLEIANADEAACLSSAAASDPRQMRDEEVRRVSPADATPEAGEQPAQNERD